MYGIFILGWLVCLSVRFSSLKRRVGGRWLALLQEVSIQLLFVAETLVSEKIWRRGVIPLAVSLQVGVDAISVNGVCCNIDYDENLHLNRSIRSLRTTREWNSRFSLFHLIDASQNAIQDQYKPSICSSPAA